MKPRVPSHLSKPAKAWWKKIQAEYSISDRAGLLILQTVFESYDRMKSLQSKIAQDGEMILDRFNAYKPNPLLAAERDSRAAMLQALKMLNLDLEPIKDVGRPPGS